MQERSKTVVTIRYCTQCNWLLRSGWMAQELLHTFADTIGGVLLVPGTGGVFEVHADTLLLWERKRDGGFPDIRVLKQKVRDVVDPDLSLGHTDSVTS